MCNDTLENLKHTAYADIRETLQALVNEYGVQGAVTKLLTTSIERPVLPVASDLNANHTNGVQSNVLALLEVLRAQALLIAQLSARVTDLESKKATTGGRSK
jgi:MarR-like DNA-binding transcriptional regulator SgrR of sgrS sRNA